MKVGYVGLGAMGGALARWLIAPFSLVAWDLRKESVLPLVEAGATGAESLADMARACEIIVLCLPRSADVRQAIFGPAGLAEGLSAGKIIIDQTSGIPSETRQIAAELEKLGVMMVDAPVAGGVPAAQAGKITIMTSGPDAAFEKAMPVLEAISPKVIRCGKQVGDGQVAKLVNNAVNAGYRVGTFELAALAVKSGIPLQALTDAMNRSWAGNFSSRSHLPAAIEKRPSADFALALMLKDLNQALALGVSTDTPMPIGNLTRTVMQIGINTLGPNARLDDVVPLIGSLSGVDFNAVSGIGTPLPDAESANLKIGLVVGQDADASLIAELLAGRADVEVVSSTGNELAALVRDKDIIVSLDGDLSNIASAIGDSGVSLVDLAAIEGAGPEESDSVLLCGGEPEAVSKIKAALEMQSNPIIYCGAAGNAQKAAMIVNAAGACNRLVAYENAAMGIKSGLNVLPLSNVLSAGSGWSFEADRALPAMETGAPTTEMTLAQILAALTETSRLGVNHGLPLMVLNEVRAICLSHANETGPEATLDAMAAHYRRAAKLGV